MSFRTCAEAGAGTSEKNASAAAASQKAAAGMRLDLKEGLLLPVTHPS
jgi:hypothetical protein